MLRRIGLTLIALLLPLGTAAQTTFTLAPVAQQSFTDNNGNPAAGYKLCSFASGTSTPATTYSDILGTPNANPIILDASGRPSNGATEVGIYLAQSSYKFVLLTPGSDTTCNTGSTVWSRDPVPAVPTSSASVDVTGTAGESISAGQVAYLSDGSGAKTAGRWYKADATTTYSSISPEIGVALAAITAGQSGTIRVSGQVTGLSALSTGASYFVSGTPGSLTSSAPANRRFVGAADSTTTLVLSGNPPLLSDGSAVTNLNAAALTTGTVATARLGSGAASVETVLRGDQTWATGFALVVQGRLTLTTATPVTTSDVTAATTLYYTPYGGNRLALYNGTNWQLFTFTELSIAVPATTSTMYDVFVYDNSGTRTLEVLAWTNDTTRATALTTQDGVYVKLGATTRRYLGSFRTTAVSGQTEDSFAKRFVWNYYNRVRRALRVRDTTDTWTYTTATYRQANASTANQVAVVIGVAEVAIDVTVNGLASNTNTSVNPFVGIGEDSTTTLATGCYNSFAAVTIANQLVGPTASLRTAPTVGYHFYAWLEISTAAGTTTWYGDNGATVQQTGIQGTVEG